MHDPMTQAFQICLWYRTSRFGNKPWRSWVPLFTIWHVDPERGGSDDSCGWFMRASHGNEETLTRIIKRFEFDWDRTFESGDKIYCSGMFEPITGIPTMSSHAITLNLFLLAALEYFDKGRDHWRGFRNSHDRARKFLQHNLAEILLFAENPSDSLHHGITQFYGSDVERSERIRSMAVSIYGWILRTERPWYRHPRWHIWHWKIQNHCLQQFKRWAFSRCSKCGKGFAWGYAPCTDSWSGSGPQWFHSEENTYHSDCERPTSECVAKVAQG